MPIDRATSVIFLRRVNFMSSSSQEVRLSRLRHFITSALSAVPFFVPSPPRLGFFFETDEVEVRPFLFLFSRT